MKVSVVIVTLNRNRILPATIPSILDSKLVDELLIIEGFKPSALGREIGWRQTRNPYVCFIDDDEIMPQGWMENLAEAFNDPLVGAVSSTLKPLRNNFLSTLECLIQNHSLLRNHVHARFVRRVALESIGGYDSRVQGMVTVYAAKRMVEKGWKTVVVDYPLWHNVKYCRNLRHWIYSLTVTAQESFHDKVRYGELLGYFKKAVFSPLRGFQLAVQYRKPFLWLLYPLRCWLYMLGMMGVVIQ